MMCAVQCYVPQLNLISALEVVKCVRDDIKSRCENMTEKYVQKLTADFVSSNNVDQRGLPCFHLLLAMLLSLNQCPVQIVGDQLLTPSEND